MRASVLAAAVTVLGACDLRSFCGGCPSDTVGPISVSPSSIPLVQPTTIRVHFDSPEPAFEPPFDSSDATEDVGIAFFATTAVEDDSVPRLVWTSESKHSRELHDVRVLDDRTFTFIVELPADFGPGPYRLYVDAAEPEGSCRGARGGIDLTAAAIVK